MGRTKLSFMSSNDKFTTYCPSCRFVTTRSQSALSFLVQLSIVGTLQTMPHFTMMATGVQTCHYASMRVTFPKDKLWKIKKRRKISHEVNDNPFATNERNLYSEDSQESTDFSRVQLRNSEF